MADLARVGSARALRRHAGHQAGAVRELLGFVLAGEAYAVDLTRIREILSPPPLTLVPRAAADVLGLCSVRGLLVTVLDLRRCVGVAESAPTRRTRLLLTEAEGGEVLGLLVDEVHQVVRLGQGEVEPAAGLGADVGDHVMGVGRRDGAMIVILDLAVLLARRGSGAGARDG